MLTEYVFATETSEFVGEVIGLSLVMLGGLGIVVSSAILLRGSARSILRYRRARARTGRRGDASAEQLRVPRCRR